MAEVFLDVVNMSLTASWLIAVIIVLRILLKKAPKWLMPVLWGVAGLRLIIPFSLESNLSLIPNAKPLPEEMLHENTFLVYSGVPVIDEPVNRFLAGREVEAASEKMTGQGHLMTVLGIVWVIGVCVMLLYALFSYIRLKSQVRASIRYEGNVWLSDQISSPFILGVIRPKIFLPIGLDSENERYVLAHERAHLKRLDHIIKPIGFVVLCVYWFNPLVWVAYILLCKDIELACDEKVIAGYEFGEKKAYAAALLDCSMHRRMVMACPLAFGEVGVKERVKSVLNYKKPAFWIIIIALVVCAVTGVCFLTNPVQAINVPKDPIIFVAKNSLDEEPALYWESEGLKYQFFMELTPDMVGECIGYDEYDGQKISNICKVKGMSEKEWICETPQSEINKDTKGFVWKEVNVTDIPEGWEPLPFAETATSSNKEEPFVQGTYSSGDLDESREQNEGDKDVPTENANDWMDIKLPKDYAISGYQDNIGWQGGFMILPQSYEVYDEEGVYAPAEWTYSGLISRIPASSTEVTYSRGAGFPDMSGLPRDNHTVEEYIDTFKVPGSREQKQWHAIVRKVNHDLYTPSNIDMLEKEGKDMENMSQTSDYWEFWFVKEGEETYYILTLSAKEFTWEEALRIVGNLRINAK